MTSPSKSSKKQKVDLNALAKTVWEHYRNYLDSLQKEEEGGGDTDELQELIELASPHVKPFTTNNNADNNENEWRQVTDLLPILLSVACYHLADGAIAEYLASKEQQQLLQQEDDDEKAKEIQGMLTQSLEWYPSNAATWSMGANFGRMSHRLSLAFTRGWYERAVECARHLRQRALQVLEDETIDDPLVKEWVELLILNQVVGVEFETDNDDNDDDDGEEENEKEEEPSDEDEEKEGEEEEEDGQYSSSAVEATSRFMCAMLWSIEGRHDGALKHLQKFPLTHRLHPNVWTVSTKSQQQQHDDVPVPPPKAAPLVFRPPQGILPESLYQSMTQIFAPDAVYWKESSYSNRGYHSYFMDYEKDRAPRNVIEDMIVNHLLPRADQVLLEKKGESSSSICGFEWWVHTRPIQANLGHNLHFDTDESMLAQEGKVTHPILSSVLYLTGGGDDEAGATIVLDQTPDSEKVAESCWQCIPKNNALMIFPGNLLHGVLPCPGHTESTSQQDGHDDAAESSSVEQLMQSWNTNESPPGTTDTDTPPKPHRLTFMVGFWTRNVPATMKDRQLYGPCGPLPPATEEHTWVREMSKGYDAAAGSSTATTTTTKAEAAATMTAEALPRVTPAWETIIIEPEETDVEEPPLLHIPHAIDHRFFVHGAPQCFRQSLFEDQDGDICE